MALIENEFKLNDWMIEWGKSVSLTTVGDHSLSFFNFASISSFINLCLETSCPPVRKWSDIVFICWCCCVHSIPSALPTACQPCHSKLPFIYQCSHTGSSTAVVLQVEEKTKKEYQSNLLLQGRIPSLCGGGAAFACNARACVPFQTR